MSYKIDSGVPMPATYRPTQYPFGDMMIGDSFLVAYNGEEDKVVRARVATAASTYSRNYGGKFSVRVLQDGVRVWKTA